MNSAVVAPTTSTVQCKDVEGRSDLAALLGMGDSVMRSRFSLKDIGSDPWVNCAAMNPAHAQLLREGLLLQQRGRSAEAEVIFRKLLKQDPQQADGWRLLGLIELARGDLLAAGQSLGHSLRLRADHPQAWHGLGEVHEESGRPADAEACYRRAGELKPDWAEAHYNQARMLHRLGQLEAARQPLQLCLRFKPATVGAWQLQAMLEQAAGAMDAALLSLDRALQLAPGRAALHHNRAVVLQCSHQHALALQAHEQAQALGLDMADAHYNHGNTLFSLGQPAAAAAAYRKALARDPQHALAQYDLAKLRWSQGEADFLGELEAAEQAAPQSAIPCGIKAGLLLKAERYQDAAAAFERACLLAPQVAAYFDGFGQALCQLGQFDAALQAHQQALTLSPRDATLHCHQARCLLAAGFAQQAAAAAGQGDIERLLREARLHLRVGKGRPARIERCLQCFLGDIDRGARGLPLFGGELAERLQQRGQLTRLAEIARLGVFECRRLTGGQELRQSARNDVFEVQHLHK